MDVRSYLKRFAIYFAVIAPLFLGAYFLITDGGSGKASASTSIPVTMQGMWHQTKNGIPNTEMSAVIAGDTIKITLKLGDSTGLFWDGTFDSGKSPTDKFTTISVGNQDTMEWSMYASSETSKEFSYSDGELVYQFSIMGAETMVHLSK